MRRPVFRSGMVMAPRVNTSLCFREVWILPSFVDSRFFAPSNWLLAGLPHTCSFPSSWKTRSRSQRSVLSLPLFPS